MKRMCVLLGAVALAGVHVATALAESDTTQHNVTINVNEVALLNNIGAEPSFTIGAPVGALGGEAVTVTSTNEDAKYLQYTSLVAASGERRKITVHVDDAGEIPAGTSLRVTAENATGQGTLGAAVTTPVTLTGTAQDLVTGIGSGHTGIGDTDGVNLTFDLSIDDVAALVFTSSAVNVLYTLTAGE